MLTKRSSQKKKRNNNKSLYESIIKDVSKVVKKHLNEMAATGIKTIPMQKLTADDYEWDMLNSGDEGEAIVNVDLYLLIKKHIDIFLNYGMDYINDYLKSIKNDPERIQQITVRREERGSASVSEAWFDYIPDPQDILKNNGIMSDPVEEMNEPLFDILIYKNYIL